MKTYTQKFINKWFGYKFQSSTTKTPEFKTFAREFKKAMQEQVKECFDIVNYSVGHFYVSGFLKHKETGEFWYFSISDVRGFGNEWLQDVLYRTAEHEKDYTGGSNQYMPLAQFHTLCDCE